MCSTGVVDSGQGLSRNRHSPVLMLLNHLASASWQRCIEAIAYVIREADERAPAAAPAASTFSRRVSSTGQQRSHARLPRPINACTQVNIWAGTDRALPGNRLTSPDARMMVISMQWSRCSMRATLAACTENLTGWHCADSSLMIGDEPSPLASVTAASGHFVYTRRNVMIKIDIVSQMGATVRFGVVVWCNLVIGTMPDSRGGANTWKTSIRLLLVQSLLGTITDK